VRYKGQKKKSPDKKKKETTPLSITHCAKIRKKTPKTTRGREKMKWHTKKKKKTDPESLRGGWIRRTIGKGP